MPSENAHDQSYKLLFSQPEMIAALLEGIIAGDWRDSLDLSTLTPLPTEHISEQLEQRRNDLVWQVRRTDGTELYLLLMLEHQSRNDLGMALRMYTYRGLLYESLLRSKQIRLRDGLPVLLPIVLYSGVKKWTAKADVAELMQAAPQGLQSYQPSHRYLLIDEGQLAKDASLPPENLARLLFRLEHNRGIEDVQELLQSIYDQTSTRREVRRAFLSWIRLVLLPRALPDVKLPQLHNFMEVKEMLVENSRSWIDQWKQEGLQEGILLGREEGRQQGWRDAIGQVLAKQLQSQFGPLPQWAQQRLQQADAETLTEWATRVLTASTLEQVFQD